MTDKTVTHEYADVVESLIAKRYRARAVGRVRSDGMWEGWIEFVDLEDDERLRTDIETCSPTNEHSGTGPPVSVRRLLRVPSGARARVRPTDQRGSTRRFRPCDSAPFSIHLRWTRWARASSRLS